MKILFVIFALSVNYFFLSLSIHSFFLYLSLNSNKTVYFQKKIVKVKSHLSHVRDFKITAQFVQYVQIQ